MRINVAFVMILLLLTISSISFSQVYTDLEAKRVLRELGISSSKIIHDAEVIVILPGEIRGVGGLSIDLPILDFITNDQIILLNGVSGYVTKRGVIIIEADLLYVSGVVFSSGIKKYFIAGSSLKDIANYLIK